MILLFTNWPHSVELHFAGYKFATLNDFFVVHLEHAYSYDTAIPIPLKNSIAMENFILYLKTNYGATDIELESVTKTVQWAKRYARRYQRIMSRRQRKAGN